MQRLPITPRRHTFSLEEVLATDWYLDDPFCTALFNAMSMAFPKGEKFFIDSVREFQDDVEDPVLRAELRGFVSQEATHRREHQKYNERLCAERGYQLEAMEQPWEELTTWAEANISRHQRLALTVAYEHLTALLAEWILRNSADFDEIDDRIAAIWRWHAVEETEHKAVAFDVYKTVGGRQDRLQAALRIATVAMIKDVLRTAYLMLRNDGQHLRPQVWWSGIKFLLGREGLITKSAAHWRMFLRRDFHPWDHDNRELIETSTAELGATL